MWLGNRLIRGTRVQRLLLLIGVAAVIASGIFLWRRMVRTDDQASHDAELSSPTYVGGVRCAECHPLETQAWRASHHAQAMQQASDATVLGKFDDAQFTKNGVTSQFFKRNGRFCVRTDGPDGQLRDYELQYTFGVFPLQQYLVPFPKGRLQSLPLAWDSRPEKQEGQRWFHLYPNQVVLHSDPLHWTGHNQTWNYMCAECHSTNLR